MAPTDISPTTQKIHDFMINKYTILDELWVVNLSKKADFCKSYGISLARKTFTQSGTGIATLREHSR
jgi:hypothetical protein